MSPESNDKKRDVPVFGETTHDYPLWKLRLWAKLKELKCDSVVTTGVPNMPAALAASATAQEKAAHDLVIKRPSWIWRQRRTAGLSEA